MSGNKNDHNYIVDFGDDGDLHDNDHGNELMIVVPLQLILSKHNGTGYSDVRAVWWDALAVEGIVTSFVQLDILSKYYDGRKIWVLELELYAGHGAHYRNGFMKWIWRQCYEWNLYFTKNKMILQLDQRKFMKLILVYKHNNNDWNITFKFWTTRYNANIWHNA